MRWVLVVWGYLICLYESTSLACKRVEIIEGYLYVFEGIADHIPSI